MRTTDRAEAGFALGHLIDEQGELAREGVEMGTTAAETTAEVVEEHLYRFGGRYAVALLLPGLERIYLDPMGSLAAVWCSELRRVASTPSLLLFDQEGHPLFERQPGEFPGNR